MKRIIFVIFLSMLLSHMLVKAQCSELGKNEIKAQGAVLKDKKTGRILWSKNSSEPLAMASTTKIMTAVIALECGNVSDIVTVSKKAAAAPAVKMYLQPEEEISLQNLLYALMLQSSNDAAVAIAEHIGGDVDTFCEMMTKKAAEIGCNDTIFRTPNGLDSLDHHSTAEDMAVIAGYALDNEDFVKLINTRQVSFKSNKKSYDVVNKNRLLSEYNGAVGVKTGFTAKAGHCFVGAAKRDDMVLISVVLASGWGNSGKNQKWVDTKALLDYGFDNFVYEQIAEKGAVVGRAQVLDSDTEKINLCLNSGLTLPLSKEEKSNLSISFDMPKVVNAPIKKGDLLGKATVTISDNEKYEIEIVSQNSAELFNFKTVCQKLLIKWLKICF